MFKGSGNDYNTDVLCKCFMQPLQVEQNLMACNIQLPCKQGKVHLCIMQSIQQWCHPSLTLDGAAHRHTVQCL